MKRVREAPPQALRRRSPERFPGGDFAPFSVPWGPITRGPGFDHKGAAPRRCESGSATISAPPAKRQPITAAEFNTNPAQPPFENKPSPLRKRSPKILGSTFVEVREIVEHAAPEQCPTLTPHAALFFLNRSGKRKARGKRPDAIKPWGPLEVIISTWWCAKHPRVSSAATERIFPTLGYPNRPEAAG